MEKTRQERLTQLIIDQVEAFGIMEGGLSYLEIRQALGYAQDALFKKTMFFAAPASGQ